MSSDLHFQIKLRSRIGFLNVSRIELKFSHFFTTSYGQKNKGRQKDQKKIKEQGNPLHMHIFLFMGTPSPSHFPLACCML